MDDSKGIQQKHLDRIPATINESIEYLKSCKDYTTDAASHQHIKTLDDATQPGDHGHRIAKYVGGSGIGSAFPAMIKCLLAQLYAEATEHRDAETSYRMTVLLANISNMSAECGLALARFGGISLFFEGLEQIKNTKNRDLTLSEWKNNIFLTLHNGIRLCPGNLTYYRNCNAVAILKAYLSGSDQEEQFFSLLILAYIATDLEKKELASADRGVRLLVHTLKKAVMTYPKNARVGVMGFSAFEILDATNKLAINNDVKNTVAKENGIPAMVKMLQDNFSSEEHKVAAETVWNMAFVDSIRQSNILQETIPTLEKLTKSTDKEVRRACVSALFEIQGSVTLDIGTPSRNAPNTLPPSYQEAISEPAPTGINRHVQIMISYQWDSQDRVKQIRDNLVASGYKIWMDVTNIRGDILKAMADAVEKSEVVLICMTEQYKDSQAVGPASYAFKLKKKIIPLLLQKDYKPDGWLGLIQGMDLYYSFYSDELVNESMDELLNVLGEQTRSDGDEVDGPIRPISQEAQGAIMTASPGKQNKAAVARWSKEDVQRWLKEHDFGEVCEKFRRFDGRHLKFKYNQYCKDDAKFKDDMKADYGMDDAVYTDFIVNLQDAFGD